MSASSIKRSQKESLLFRAISQLFMQTTLDDKRLEGIFVNRVKLSDDKGVCTIFFYTPGGLAEFKEKLPIILLYKSSLRKALANRLILVIHLNWYLNLMINLKNSNDLENILEKIKGDDSSTS